MTELGEKREADETQPAPPRPGGTEPETVGTGSALAIGCVVLALALLVIAIVARVAYGLW